MNTLDIAQMDVLKQPKEIIKSAIDRWNPSHIICLYSGGYDSLVTTHLSWRIQNEFNLPMYVYSIDTQLSADGWRDYAQTVANRFKWRFDIYDNMSGFFEYLIWVLINGQPRTPNAHKKVYNRLKGRAIAQMLKDHKRKRPDKTKNRQNKRYDKVLFLSGIRQSESEERGKLESPINRAGNSNAVFANPIFYWEESDLLEYRTEHDLPFNPFYETVGGSGDCQCNWGLFISLLKLIKYSPNLAKGNVSIIHELSRQFHGYGWDGKSTDLDNQMSMFDGTFEDDSEFEKLPFLCAGCSRSKSPRPGRKQAEEAIQMDIFGDWG